MVIISEYKEGGDEYGMIYGYGERYSRLLLADELTLRNNHRLKLRKNGVETILAKARTK